MSTAAQLDLISVENYLTLDDETRDARLEYAAGHVFALAGASRRHVAITRNLTIFLQTAGEAYGCDAYSSDLRLRVAADMYFYPDVMLACGDREGTDRDETAPTLLAEVLSDSTNHRDFGLKLAAYRALPSLLGYLIVSQDSRRVELHWREDVSAAWRHQVLTGKATVHLPALGGLALPLDQVYARTGV